MSASGPSERRCLCLVSFLKKVLPKVQSPLSQPAVSFYFLLFSTFVLILGEYLIRYIYITLVTLLTQCGTRLTLSLLYPHKNYNSNPLWLILKLVSICVAASDASQTAGLVYNQQGI